jgi:hypothetical protein
MAHVPNLVVATAPLATLALCATRQFASAAAMPPMVPAPFPTPVCATSAGLALPVMTLCVRRVARMATAQELQARVHATLMPAVIRCGQAHFATRRCVPPVASRARATTHPAVATATMAGPVSTATQRSAQPGASMESRLSILDWPLAPLLCSDLLTVLYCFALM